MSSVAPYVAGTVGGWLILSTVIASVPWRLNRRDRTVRITGSYPPPISPAPLTQADVDAVWLSVWPVEIASQSEIALRFDQIISAEWEWPDTEGGNWLPGSWAA